VDIKCATDGHVLVYVPENTPLPDRENVIQSVGRGNRSRGDYQGIFYIHCLEEM
jgi:hypothetical protein